MTTQIDLFDQPAAHGPGQRQTDIESLIAEQETRLPAKLGDPFPNQRKFWPGETWGSVIDYYASYMKHSPKCDGFMYWDGGRLYVCHYGGRGDPTLRQVVPKSLEAYAMDVCRAKGSTPETARR